MRARILLVCFVVGAPLSARANGRHGHDAAAEEAQRRALMAELSAAAAEAPQQRTDADLMYEAMRQWRGEPRGSAAVARVLAQSKQDQRERKEAEAKLRYLFFKDPFAEDPNLLIPVRKVDRQLLATYEVRHEIDRSSRSDDQVSRLRSQLAEARADAAAARAEANRLRSQLARGDGEKSDGECVATTSHAHSRVHGSHPLESADRVSDWDAPAPARRHHRKPRAPSQVALTAPETSPAAEKVTATAPEGARSSDPRGIIVVPIETPVAIRADARR